MSGFFLQGGHLPVPDLRAQLGISESMLGMAAFALTCPALAQGRIRAYQGHDLDHMCPRYSEAALRSLEREFRPFLWHGTDSRSSWTWMALFQVAGREVA